LLNNIPANLSPGTSGKYHWSHHYAHRNVSWCFLRDEKKTGMKDSYDTKVFMDSLWRTHKSVRKKLRRGSVLMNIEGRKPGLELFIRQKGAYLK